MNIVILDSVNTVIPECLEKIQSLGNVTSYEDVSSDVEEKVRRAKDAEVLIIHWSTFRKEEIEQCPNLKMIIMGSAGYSAVDFEYAAQKGITVSHCPGNNANAVAEHVFGLILSVTRNICKANTDVHNGVWKSKVYMGSELQDKTLGLVGFGAIGKRVAEIATNGFGMNVLHVNSKSTTEDLHSMLEKSDIVSVNTPLNEKTKNLISHSEFEQMKDGVIILNTSRGAVIDEEALIANLESGKIRAAALDVMTIEPPEPNHKLFSFPNVVITPHIAWHTPETEERRSMQTLRILESYIAGDVIHIVPELQQ